MPKHFTWHDLRHFYASALIQAGASVKTVQVRLGHSDANTTLRVYTHLWPDQDSHTREAIETLFAAESEPTPEGYGGTSGDGTDGRRDTDGTGALE
ncbi:hypothetical protein BJ987_005044 [Nocardia goodfellowii]|uniref:Tyr recombinase domain-containing protein n=1 Tax=Nocardia goodfellowii TaxID=882446 RepID=A0ABS4QM24_9NOCA|nr:hypothetical protein [Nocardia goodfellowii]